MNLSKMKLTIIGICGLMLVPFSSHASSATLINDNTVLFTVDFSFYDNKFATEIPLMAEFGVEYIDRVNTVGFNIESNGEDAEVENVSALVLSKHSINGNRYVLDTETEGDFTLMILATFAEPVVTSKQATITKIPFWTDGRRTTVHTNQLDDIEPAILNLSGAILNIR